MAGSIEEALGLNYKFKIDNDLRTISVPKGAVFGVFNDRNVQVIDFEMPRYYHNIDLSTFQIRVNYIGGGQGDIYLVTDAVAANNKITFSWTVNIGAYLQNGGTVTFSVCLRKVNDQSEVTQEFNTTIQTVSVLPGLEITIDEADEETVHDYLTQIQNIVTGMEETAQEMAQEIADEVIASIPENYTTLSNNVTNLNVFNSKASTCLGYEYFIEYPGWIDSSNRLVSYGLSRYIVIPVKGGDIISKAYKNNEYFVVLKSFTFYPALPYNYDYATGESSRRVEVTNLELPDDAKFILLSTKTNDGVSVSSGSFTINGESLNRIDDINYTVNRVNSVVSNLDPRSFSNFKYGLEFVSRDIVSQPGPDFGKLGRNKFRISNKYVYSFPYDVEFSVPSDIRILYYVYESISSETATTGTNWATHITIAANTCFRLQMRNEPENSSIVYDDPYNTNLFEGLLASANGEIETLPQYWQSHMDSKIATINNLNCGIGSSGDSFVFMTDYHVTTSFEKSNVLMRYIKNNTSITKYFYGGDTSDSTGSTQESIRRIRAFFNKFKEFNLLTVRGNHDCQPAAGQWTDYIPDNAFYDVFIRPIENYINTDGNIYYYLDNKASKIRYIVMDSGATNNPLDETQLNWLKSRLTELPSGWTVFVFQHMIGEGTENQTVYVSSRGAFTINAINSVLPNMNATIGAVIAGHVHNDYIDTTYATYPIIYTTCDSGGANAAYDWSNPTRTAETTSECAFDVFTVNTSLRKINITRIGVGLDREVTY